MMDALTVRAVTGRGRTCRLLRRIFTLLAAMSLTVLAGAGVARAQPSPPPITTPPAATATQPPAEAIIDLVEPVDPCSDWSLQSEYGGAWPTDSTWWEYTCQFQGGTVNAPPPIDYYYWDSAQATSVYYGQMSFKWDDWTGGSCVYWWDQATSQTYGPYGCSLSTTPPTASFTVSCTGLTCSFDGSGSTDSDGTVQEYWWSFGDGIILPSQNSTVTHTYPAAGTYTVQLEVFDDLGATDAVTRAVTVAASPNQPPTASFTVICSGLSCSFDATGSTDSDGTIQGYWWDFGDGSPAGGNTSIPTHTYAGAGSYTVTLRVTDNAGATSAAVAQPVTLDASPNQPPTASFTVACSGLRCSLDGAGSADSDGTITAYGWTFGDGSSGDGATVQHSYPRSGSYPVTLTVTDNSGATATTTEPVTLISVTASGSKVRGVATVDLSWNGSDAVSYDVQRNNVTIATVTGGRYTDTIGKSGRTSYTYQVCQATTAICCNQVPVTF